MYREKKKPILVSAFWRSSGLYSAVMVISKDICADWMDLSVPTQHTTFPSATYGEVKQKPFPAPSHYFFT